jgi:TRAP-type C4-dicarboxylate transport system permease small subunit
MAFVYAIIASKVSYGFVFDAYRRHMGSASWLMTPLWIPQMMLPIGFTLLSLVLIPEIAQAIRNAWIGISTEAISAEKAEGSGV